MKVPNRGEYHQKVSSGSNVEDRLEGMRLEVV